MKPRILLLEDEENLQEVIQLNLEAEGYDVVSVNDGNKAMKTFKEQHFDLAILDVMVPYLNGLDVCEQIRLENSQISIMILTAKGNSEDKIQGLKRGADDYLTKPFNLEEFLLRVKVLLKRNATHFNMNENEMLHFAFGNNIIDFVTYKAKTAESIIDLTKKEVKLLKLLIERKDEVVSRQTILQNVWGYEVFPNTRTIDNFILNFRKYFENNDSEIKHFHSIRGVGYKFTAA